MTQILRAVLFANAQQARFIPRRSISRCSHLLLASVFLPTRSIAERAPCINKVRK
jgi:hypothetical protein